MIDVLIDILQDDRGATAVEYGLIVALVAMALVVSLASIGGSIASIFDIITGEFDASVTP